MKVIFKVLKVIGVILLLFFMLIVVLFIWASFQPAVKEGYYENVNTIQPLEQKYTNLGIYEVGYQVFEVNDDVIKKYQIWYPVELESLQNAKRYPLVIMANGSGVPASKYQAIFAHLASWGFVVIGNEDGSSWSGKSSAQSLDYILNLNKNNESIFYQKIDLENIGVAGHSQGGVGAINAVTAQENGDCYKTIYTASTTHLALAEALGWPYDVSKITIPYFMTAGTLEIDAGNGKDPGIAPLFSLQENYDGISDDVAKIYARRVNTEHGNMLPYADGYMTAWLMYHLQGDEEAGKVFWGDDAEILSNKNWQDVKKNQ